MNYVLLNPVSVETLLVVVAIVAVLAVAFAVFIVLVSKLCAVPEDEKTEKIKEQLAGANCGGCGYAGCSDFAKALAEGKADISKCGPTPAANKAAIAEILGIPFAAGEETGRAFSRRAASSSRRAFSCASRSALLLAR